MDPHVLSSGPRPTCLYIPVTASDLLLLHD